MDKRKRLKHAVNKAKEESTMEKKMNHKSKSIHDILPLDLIHIILLRVPIRHLARLRCVSKLWCSLISDPDFAESHLHLSLAPTHGCLVRLDDSTEAYLVHLEEVFNGDNYQLMKEVSFPFKKKPPSEFCVMGSCRGFVLLSREPYFFVVWNPVTGFRKRISYSCMFHRSKLRCLKFPRDALLYGFGYDASRDDYLIVVASEDGGCQHLDCLSLRTNSWISLDAALPKPLGFMKRRPPGLFLNGSIHWLCYSHKKHYSESILTFDLKERSFSKISLPEKLRMHGRIPATIVTLGGYIALCYQDFVIESKTLIWVMKEYKVNSSWTLYEIPCIEFEPLCLSNGSDIIALDPTTPVSGPLKFAKYNIREELLQHFTCPPHLGQERYFFLSYTVYTESLLLLPSDI
ncbi:F-box protein [Arachis hypogaea]|nr:F-box protein [Arachis hypogaea]